MFSKVIPQVATLFEHATTTWVLTFEVEFDSLCLRIFHSYGLVPLFRDAFESLVLISS
jgi:hypothetical protein